MSEVGTLKELNVHPGDVVENQKSMMHYPITEDMQVGGVPVRRAIDQYRIISRAKPLIDLTTNTSAWGLCSDEWRAAMQAHMNAGGEYEWYCANGTWSKRNTPLNDPPLYGIYRAKPGPVVTVKMNYGWANVYSDGDVGILAAEGIGYIPGTLTTTFHDGKPVKAEWVTK